MEKMTRIRNWATRLLNYRAVVATSMIVAVGWVIGEQASPMTDWPLPPAAVLAGGWATLLIVVCAVRRVVFEWYRDGRLWAIRLVTATQALLPLAVAFATVSSKGATLSIETATYILQGHWILAQGHWILALLAGAACFWVLGRFKTSLEDRKDAPDSIDGVGSVLWEYKFGFGDSVEEEIEAQLPIDAPGGQLSAVQSVPREHGFGTEGLVSVPEFPEIQQPMMARLLFKRASETLDWERIHHRIMLSAPWYVIIMCLGEAIELAFADQDNWVSSCPCAVIPPQDIYESALAEVDRLQTFDRLAEGAYRQGASEVHAEPTIPQLELNLTDQMKGAVGEVIRLSNVGLELRLQDLMQQVRDTQSRMASSVVRRVFLEPWIGRGTEVLTTGTSTKNHYREFASVFVLLSSLHHYLQLSKNAYIENSDRAEER